MNGYETYQESEIHLADPVRLIELLYRGALESVRHARVLLSCGDIEGRGRAVSKASAILIELASCLDHERGGEISRNLAEIYGYLQWRLTEGHSNQQDEPLAEVERIMDQLTSAWSACRIAELQAPAPLLPQFDADAPRQLSCSF